MNSQRLTRILPWLAASLAALCYLPTALHLGYAWDDWQLFINNPTLRLPETIWEGLTQPILPGTTYFRPIPLATLALEFFTHGVDPYLSHAVNLSIHTANTLLVGLIAVYLTRSMASWERPWRIFLAGLLYGLHPTLVEPVGWVAGRFDLLVTLFCLLTIWGYLALSGWKRTLWVTTNFLLAALSKEMAVTLPLILLLFYINFQDRGQPWRTGFHRFRVSGEWRLYAWLLAAGIAYLILRYTFMGQLSHMDPKVNEALAGWNSRIAFVGQTLIFYMKSSVWPFANLNPMHPFDPESLDFVDHITGYAAVCAAIAVSLLALRSQSRPGLLLTAGLIALLPVLNIIPLTIGGNIGHERFLTFPLALLTLAAISLELNKATSENMRRARPLLLGALASVWLGLAIINVRVTLPLWQNDLSLWTWAYQRHPDSSFIQLSYASAAIRYQDFVRAEQVLDHVDENSNYMLKALKGQYLVRTGHVSEGIGFLEDAATSLSPIHEQLSSYGLSLQSAKISRMNNQQWNYQFIYTGLAEAYNSQRTFEKASLNADIALFYAPRYPSAWMAKAFALYGLNHWEDGEVRFEQAIRYFLPQTAPEAYELRRQFLAQLCQIQDTPIVCGHWHTLSMVPEQQITERRRLLSSPQKQSSSSNWRQSNIKNG